jgi:hypothetical protein
METRVTTAAERWHRSRVARQFGLAGFGEVEISQTAGWPELESLRTRVRLNKSGGFGGALKQARRNAS